MKPGEKFGQFASREFPLKGQADGFPAILKIEEPFGNSREIRKLIGIENLSLNDEKVDFDLVEPAGVDGAVNQNKHGTLLLEALHRSHSTVGGSVVNNPEDAARIITRRPGHHLFNEVVKGSDSSAGFATAKDLNAMNIESGKMGPYAAPFMFVFNIHDGPGLCWQGGVNTGAGLDFGFLVCGNDKFIVLQRFSAPHTLVRIQNTPGLESEIRNNTLVYL